MFSEAYIVMKPHEVRRYTCPVQRTRFSKPVRVTVLQATCRYHRGECESMIVFEHERKIMYPTSPHHLRCWLQLTNKQRELASA